MKLPLLRPVVFALVAALCGCSGQAHTPPSAAAAPGPFTGTKFAAALGLYVACSPRPNPIPLNQVYSMDVSVFSDAALTKPASAVRVSVDAGMPSHGHGMNLTPRVARVGEGRFHAEGLLMHMPGPWEVYVDLEEGGRTERVAYKVEIQ
ncbi:MAG: hypothetical protein JSR77_08950 [Planctomycetes bacterium]|nr:hypothetical protein [Planctomycetota bacterium]